MLSQRSAILSAVDSYLANTAPRLSRIIVATSGGPDSQALLDALGRLAGSYPIQVCAVGIDHGLRPEAPEELLLAQRLAERHGLMFLQRAVNIDGPGNVMARARRARYRSLRAACRNFGGSSIMLGHTADDQAETVLFRLARGAGLRGASGMAAARKNLHRPILRCTRADVLAHLGLYAVPFATDPSNHNTRRSRTLIREQVLPALAQVNSLVVPHIAAFAQGAQQDEALLRRMARKLHGRAVQSPQSLCCATLARGPQALWARVLQLWLHPLGARPDAAALMRLMAVIADPGSSLSQGAVQGCTLHLRHRILWATAQTALPPRRAGTLPRAAR